jgi:hypothetical protein
VEGPSTLPDFPDFDQTEPLDLIEPDIKISSTPTHHIPQATAPSEAGTSSITAKDRILDELQNRRRMSVYSVLDDAQVEYTDGVLKITFGSEDASFQLVRDKHRPLLQEIGEKLFGQPLKIEVTSSGQIEKRVDEAELKRQQLRERAMKNPAVRLILEQTRGEIVSVKENQ